MYVYDVRVLHCYDWNAYFQQFPVPFVRMRIKSWGYTFLFSFQTQRGQLTNSARNKKRLAQRLAQSIRSQPVINTGHYQRFKHPHVTRSLPIGIAKLSEVFMN